LKLIDAVSTANVIAAAADLGLREVLAVVQHHEQLSVGEVRRSRCKPRG
jgi:hypothetical protein